MSYLEVFVIYPLYETFLKMATRVAETCTCRRCTIFIIQDTLKYLYVFDGIIFISDQLNA